jgi:hypothetical protein
MTAPMEHDWPPAMRRHRRRPEIIDATYYEVRRRRPVGFGTSLLIVTVAAVIVLRFAWAPLLMGAVLLGIETPRDMAAMVIGIIILAAKRLAGRRF